MSDESYPATSRQAFENFVRPVLDKLAGRTTGAHRNEAKARKVVCVFCKAQPGDPCTLNGRERALAHPSRYETANLRFPRPDLARPKASAASTDAVTKGAA